MNKKRVNAIEQMNAWGASRIPFVFLIDFEFKNPLVLTWKESKASILWQTPDYQNFKYKKEDKEPFTWKMNPVDYGTYQTAFQQVQHAIQNGETYLLNLSYTTNIETNLTLEEIFKQAQAPYKILLKNRFACFSPEIFVRMEGDTISSFPMKGTIDANLPNAREIVLSDKKEHAEHNTIVDLIRNDLSMVASGVRVEKFRYVEKISTNRKDLLQVSSEIKGNLPRGYNNQLGTIIDRLLPAGSISGAPKRRTVEIINATESTPRGYYTGIFGIFDGNKTDSTVLIRFMDQNGEKLVFRSGGGITHLSKCKNEYEELINKVYVPVG